MTKEDRELLLKDLCARLPYGVKLDVEGCRNGKLTGIEGDKISTEYGINYPFGRCKPYLRPILSMSEEEFSEYQNARKGKYHDEIDWLNANYFDYRGLIEKGLALEAPEDMYKI